MGTSTSGQRTKSIARIFDRYAMPGNWNRLCDLTEPIADKLDKRIIVVYYKGQKYVVRPAKCMLLYLRDFRLLQDRSTHGGQWLPYESRFIKLCSIKPKSAELYLGEIRGRISPRGAKYKIERAGSLTLF
jgi:hypothetical protein